MWWKKKNTSTLKCLEKALKEEKSPQKIISESVRIRNRPRWFGPRSRTFPHPNRRLSDARSKRRAKPRGRLRAEQLGKDNVGSNEFFLLIHLGYSSAFLYHATKPHWLFLSKSAPQFLITSSKASFHYSYPMAELL